MKPKRPQEYLQLNPASAEAEADVAKVLEAAGRDREAEPHYRAALDHSPEIHQFHTGLARVLTRLGRYDEAESCYRRAIRLRPDDFETHYEFVGFLNELGRHDEIEAFLNETWKSDPASLQWGFLAHSIPPVIPGSAADLARWRSNYQSGTVRLQGTDGILDESGARRSIIGGLWLAYDNKNNRSLLEARSRLFREKFPLINYSAPTLLCWQPPAKGQRIRIGFISGYFNHSSVTRLYQGFLRLLNREHFEIWIFRTHDSVPRDAATHYLESQVDHAVDLPQQLQSQRDVIASINLDVLFYLDVGTSIDTYLLAYSRLAPVQVSSWGYPDTTGLDTIDYFISAASIEPEKADDYYTERLVRLSRLPCYFQRADVDVESFDRAALGLPGTGTLYGCPQSLFKLHPDYDEFLAAIVEGDPTGHLVLVKGTTAAQSDLLMKRWSRTFPVLLERVHWVPRMSPGKVYGPDQPLGCSAGSNLFRQRRYPIRGHGLWNTDSDLAQEISCVAELLPEPIGRWASLMRQL